MKPYQYHVDNIHRPMHDGRITGVKNNNPRPMIQIQKKQYQHPMINTNQNPNYTPILVKQSPMSSSKLPAFFQQSIRNTALRKQQSNDASEQLQIKGNIHGAISKILGNNTTCHLCQIEYSSQPLISISNCAHSYCLTCLQQYVTYKINMNQQIFCPQESCDKPIDQHSNFFNDLPPKIKQKYQNCKLWRQNVNNPNVRLCPRQQCKNGLIDLLKKPPVCRNCGKSYCQNCELEAHEGSCQNNFQGNFQMWKRCPGCMLFIQKNEGCNHMTCRCGKQFCFVCLSDWQSSHYSCGVQSQTLNNTMGFGGNCICCLLCCTCLFLPIISLLLILVILLVLAVSIPTGIIALLAYSVWRMECPEQVTCRRFIFWPVFMLQACLPRR